MPAVTRTKTCDKKEEHGAHDYTVEVTKICEGKTPCGQWAHKAHDFVEKEEVRCMGICRCDQIPYRHSPLNHITLPVKKE